jgi:peptide/nickel transport system permease protein
MAAFIVRRLLIMFPVLWGLLTLTFLSLHLIPGDPVSAIASQGAHAAPMSKATILAMRHELGLDKPLLIQYWDYIRNAATFNFGSSLRTNQPVFDEIWSRFPTTVNLAALSLVITVIVGIVSGVLSAIFNRKPFGVAITALAVVGISIPDYWMGTMLSLAFGLYLGWLPVAGGGDEKHLLLPAITLAIVNGAVLTRLTRSSLLSVLGMDFIRTARAKGVPQALVVGKHALRNALIPVITVLGLMVAGLLSGVVIIEKVFAIPGVGALAVDAVAERDFPVVQGTTVFFALILLIVNLLVDVSYAFLDPRIHYS